MAMSMTADPGEHSSSDHFLGHGLAIASSMAVNNISLKSFYLFGGQNHIGQFANTGVHPVHNFIFFDFFLKQSTAAVNPLASLWMELNLLHPPGHTDQLLDSQMSIDNDAHLILPLN